jgi:excisionase family DNA binding protein
MPTERPRRLVPVADAAVYSGLSSKTLRRYIERGLLPAWRVGPRSVRVSLDDIDRLPQRILVAG